MTSLAPSLPQYGLRPSRARTAIAGFGAIVIALLATHQGAALRAAVPLLGFAAAIWVYRTAGFPAYAAFAWWFWFLAPGLRRIVDYQMGAWDPESPISIAPLLVTSVAAVVVIRRLGELRRTTLWPWAAAAACITFGYLEGVLRNGLLPATHSVLAWMVPLLFGLATALEWRNYPEFAARISKTFMWGGLLLAGYALWQFLAPPAWDRMWVESSGMTSVGSTYPYRMRVFSLMNGPLLFAVTMFASAVISLSMRGAWRIVAIVATTIAMLLTLVRSVWLVTVPAAVTYLYAMPLRMVKRAVIAGAAAVALLVGVALVVPSEVGQPVIAMVQDRAFTLGNLDQDISYSERTGFLDQISGTVLERPLGNGLGSTGVSSTLGDPTSGIKDFDNGVFAVLYSLGWFAGAALLAVAVYLILLTLPRREPRTDGTAKAARAIVIGVLMLSLGGNVFEGLPAMVFWGFLGLLMASHRWQSVASRQPRADHA